MEVLLGIVAAVLACALVAQGYLARRRREPATATVAPDELLAARQELVAAREELVASRSRLDEREQRLAVREERLSELAAGIQRDRERLDADREHLAAVRTEHADLTARALAELERIGGLRVSDARAEVLATAEQLARDDAEQRAKEISDEVIQRAEAEASRVVTIAIERVAVGQASEAVVTSVDLPSEDMKGRIIGREGRNIRAFEQLTGVTLMVDDTPGLVLLSCFDPVRREAARQALVELVADGRIDPARIEEAHEKATRNVERTCVQAAQQAIDELGLTGIGRGLLPTIGALGFRTSYGQNVLEHSSECARLAGAMAAELRLDVETCRRAAFLHDLGKAVITHGEGSHAAAGADLARRHGQSEAVVHAIAAHHNEVAPETAVDVLVQVADAISSSRPGARRESVEAYVRRLDRLEEVATRQPGVEKAYALQAGREIRVMVLPDQVDDSGAQHLARRIADEVEKELVYPGRIKVTVIRETRATEMAQ
ncbi:MAG: ribonuclease Y [Brooklawnia sp.]|uniref:ribonuclease Y n=1 Tax=Brooklawnia sp. TaxID=2699740 RepID=UPI003C749B08